MLTIISATYRSMMALPCRTEKTYLHPLHAHDEAASLEVNETIRNIKNRISPERNLSFTFQIKNNNLLLRVYFDESAIFAKTVDIGK